jgi:hypothetical protein
MKFNGRPNEETVSDVRLQGTGKQEKAQYRFI